MRIGSLRPIDTSSIISMRYKLYRREDGCLQMINTNDNLKLIDASFGLKSLTPFLSNVSD